jgi:hypothetical protein
MLAFRLPLYFGNPPHDAECKVAFAYFGQSLHDFRCMLARCAHLPHALRVMGALDRNALYARISDVLERRAGESLLDAASRVVRSGVHAGQRDVALAVLDGAGKRGDAAWRSLDSAARRARLRLVR